MNGENNRKIAELLDFRWVDVCEHCDKCTDENRKFCTMHVQLPDFYRDEKAAAMLRSDLINEGCDLFMGRASEKGPTFCEVIHVQRNVRVEASGAGAEAERAAVCEAFKKWKESR